MAAEISSLPPFLPSSLVCVSRPVVARFFLRGGGGGGGPEGGGDCGGGGDGQDRLRGAA